MTIRMVRIGFCMAALAIAAGCASSRVTESEQFVADTNLPRPESIWVADFAATPADVPADSALAGRIDDFENPQTQDQIEIGRRAGALITDRLIEEINELGLPARRYSPDAPAQVNDIVIRGYLVSISKGNTAGRFAIGFGAGASRLSTVVEGFQVTSDGMRPLALESIEARGARRPGAALSVAGLIATANPAGLIVGSVITAYGEITGRSALDGRARQTAKEIAEDLEIRFRRRGWIP